MVKERKGAQKYYVNTNNLTTKKKKMNEESQSGRKWQSSETENKEHEEVNEKNDCSNLFFK